jgi:photosystem II stability/assembly factor-like uncharacterized protein
MVKSMRGNLILGISKLTILVAVFGFVTSGDSVAAQSEGEQANEYAEKMPLADEVLVLDATATDARAVAVGTRGHVLLSEDYDSWFQADSVPTRAALTGVDFMGQQGWAVGHGSVILHSTDGGASWERQYHAPEREQPFLDVMFLDQERGFAIGAYGLFMKTDDGGGSWTEGQVSETDDWHLNAITQSPDGTLHIAAEQGIVYSSQDGGETWSATDLPYRGSMFDILVLPDKSVFVFGLRGRAFESTDGGETWNPVDTGTESSLHGGRVLRGGKLMIVGSNGVVLERDRGAERFEQRQHPSDEPLAGVLQDPSGRLIYYGVNGIGVAGDDEDRR